MDDFGETEVLLCSPEHEVRRMSSLCLGPVTSLPLSVTCDMGFDPFLICARCLSERPGEKSSSIFVGDGIIKPRSEENLAAACIA